MEGWRTERLGDLCEIVKGRKPKLKALASEGDLPYLVARVMRGSQEPEFASVSDRNSITVSEDETIIICDGSNSGEVFTGFRGILSSTMGKLVIKGGIDDAYLRAFLDSTFELFNGAKTGAAIPHLDKAALYALPFSYPPLTEQRRIVAILDEALKAIATAKTNTEQTLSKLDLLRDANLEQVFSSATAESRTQKLGDICAFRGGAQPPKSQFLYEPRDGYVRFLQIRDFGSDRHLTYIPESPKNRTCAEDDILIGRYGASVGKILTGRAGAYNVALIKATPDPALLDREYFRNYLLSGMFQSRLSNVAARSAQDGFSRDDIKDFPVPVPSITRQAGIIERLKPLNQSVRRLVEITHDRLNLLEKLKESILHDAFSGQLASRHAQEVITEAL